MYFPTTKEFDVPDLQTELSRVINAWDRDESPKETNQQPKEKAMQEATALKNPAPWGSSQAQEFVLKQDAAPVVQPAHLFKETSGVSRVTFNFVRDNPGLVRKQVQDALEVRGFKASSTSSILSLCIRSGYINEDGFGKLTAARKHYVPLSRRDPVKKPTRPRRSKAEMEQERRIKAKALAVEQTPVLAFMPPEEKKHTQPAPMPAAVTIAPVAYRPEGKPVLTAEYIMENISIAEGKKLFMLLSNTF
jgi:hypothetical protein